MGEYKHYINPKELGQLCFVTTRGLDWAHLFIREHVRSRMCHSLLQDCYSQRAKLYAYVVMSNHIHLVVRPHETKTISDLMKKVKANSRTRLQSFLEPRELRQLGQQAGLNERAVWQVSFRANPLYTKEVADQKVRYTHLNPLRAGLIEDEYEYLWSSAHVMQQGLYFEDESLDLKACKDYYASLL